MLIRLIILALLLAIIPNSVMAEFHDLIKNDHLILNRSSDPIELTYKDLPGMRVRFPAAQPKPVGDGKAYWGKDECGYKINFRYSEAPKYLSESTKTYKAVDYDSEGNLCVSRPTIMAGYFNENSGIAVVTFDRCLVAKDGEIRKLSPISIRVNYKNGKTDFYFQSLINSMGIGFTSVAAISEEQLASAANKSDDSSRLSLSVPSTPLDSSRFSRKSTGNWDIRFDHDNGLVREARFQNQATGTYGEIYNTTGTIQNEGMTIAKEGQLRVDENLPADKYEFIDIKVNPQATDRLAEIRREINLTPYSEEVEG